MLWARRRKGTHLALVGSSALEGRSFVGRTSDFPSLVSGSWKERWKCQCTMFSLDFGCDPCEETKTSTHDWNLEGLSSLEGKGHKSYTACKKLPTKYTWSNGHVSGRDTWITPQKWLLVPSSPVFYLQKGERQPETTLCYLKNNRWNSQESLL